MQKNLELSPCLVDIYYVMTIGSADSGNVKRLNKVTSGNTISGCSCVRTKIDTCMNGKHNISIILLVIY